MSTDVMTQAGPALVGGRSNAGTHAEFENHIARTKRQAYNVAFRMTGVREDAEDLVQEAYLRAYRSFDTYNRSLPFEKWFFRILSNLSIDRLRRKPKQPVISLDQSLNTSSGDDSFVLEIPDEANNPEKQLMDTVMDEKLQRALMSLPSEFRTAVLLCDLQDMSYEQVAQVMKTSIGTVRSRIHRGRQMLRQRLVG